MNGDTPTVPENPGGDARPERSRPLTAEDVYQAADVLYLERGRRPTVQRLLEHLKRGSATTISKHLRGWVANRPQLPGASSPDLLLPVWDDLRRQAHESLEPERKRLAERENALAEREAEHARQIELRDGQIAARANRIADLERLLSGADDHLATHVKMHSEIIGAKDDEIARLRVQFEKDEKRWRADLAAAVSSADRLRERLGEVEASHKKDLAAWAARTLEFRESYEATIAAAQDSRETATAMLEKLQGINEKVIAQGDQLGRLVRRTRSHKERRPHPVTRPAAEIHRSTSKGRWTRARR